MQVEKGILWQQGTLLQPQHFQLLERSGAGLLAPYRKYLEPHFWGVGALVLQKSALGVRCFELREGEFLFPDGTFVSVPDNGRVAARSLDDGWLEGGEPLTVLLGLKKWRAAGENVTIRTEQDSIEGVSRRLVAGEQAAATPDLHAGGPPAEVTRLDYVLQIFWDSELDQLGAYDLIPLARLERNGSEVRLSDCFVPPCLTCASTPALAGLVREIRDQLAARTRQLEQFKCRRGVHNAEFGSRDMAYLLALRTLNRYLPQVFHYSEDGRRHPWHLYGILRQLVGELSAFSDQVSALGAAADTTTLPAYDHRDLWGCFSAAQQLILRLLDEITAGPEYIISLNQTGDRFSADLKPTIFTGHNRFYLAVSTEADPKLVLQDLEQAVKVSAPEQVELLVARALPGIALQYLQVPPQELPRRTGTLYAAINHHDAQWSEVVKQRALALHWHGAPADLELELMVVGR
jgi:type VI secretion system protein ImpJ